METFEELIKRVVNSFNAFKLDYMFTGALAASYYGAPRSTMDVDIVVEVSRDASQIKFVPALKKAGLQVDEKSLDAVFSPAVE
ncbi:MAG: hypothetical protein NWF14_04930 [Candidatus Bathyarchaeota archaeon]|nr:hypothetical protein [Candidatus Bathyarchaeota archaeon]